MAVVDADYCFITIDVSTYGKDSDTPIFKESPFGKKLYSEQLNLPAPTCLPNTNNSPQSYVIIGDEAFGLHRNLLRPYPGRRLTFKRKIFNYRLSRARRYVECAFGILANKWRVLNSAMLVEPNFADDVVKACCILDNYVRRRDGYVGSICRFYPSFYNYREIKKRLSSTFPLERSDLWVLTIPVFYCSREI
ncbi:uncharacterized protein LOC132933104 [Metopolophium dirhodum]|uniref:uncharacterized protein LOC132933104 n=1 Tax=Metopolophium dirhodum TaxID=44670 RepID=UPI00298FA060|nr:uncharacterized protein LOC132933104 [Metopolophium dirhodum]